MAVGRATERHEMADSVFDDIADHPDEAANLTARGLLMVAIEQRIREEGWTQGEAAVRLHVTQPRISDLMNGKISKFSLDALVNMLAPVGLALDIRPLEQRSAGVVNSALRQRKAPASRRVSAR